MSQSEQSAPTEDSNDDDPVVHSTGGSEGQPSGTSSAGAVDPGSPTNIATPSSPTVWRQLPNAITLSRLGIAALLFALLSIELTPRLRTGFLGNEAVVLTIAAFVFVVCVATDAIDGWVARKYGLVSAFGRVADPFVDKIVVLGSFVYLVEITDSLVQPWYVTILVARELLVTSLRSHMESHGIEFGARRGGKIKMVVQSITVPVVLLQQAHFTGTEENAAQVNDIVLWVTVGLLAITLLSTLSSAWEYTNAVIQHYRSEKRASGR